METSKTSCRNSQWRDNKEARGFAFTNKPFVENRSHVNSDGTGKVSHAAFWCIAAVRWPTHRRLAFKERENKPRKYDYNNNAINII